MNEIKIPADTIMSKHDSNQLNLKYELRAKIYFIINCMVLQMNCIVKIYISRKRS